MRVLILLGNFMTNLNFWIPKGSAATYLRCGGKSYIYIRLLEISFSFQWWKNFENRLRFDEVTAMSLVAPLFGTRCIYKHQINVYVKKLFSLKHSVKVLNHTSKTTDIILSRIQIKIFTTYLLFQCICKILALYLWWKFEKSLSAFRYLSNPCRQRTQ